MPRIPSTGEGRGEPTTEPAHAPEAYGFRTRPQPAPTPAALPPPDFDQTDSIHPFRPSLPFEMVIESPGKPPFRVNRLFARGPNENLTSFEAALPPEHSELLRAERELSRTDPGLSALRLSDEEIAELAEKPDENILQSVVRYTRPLRDHYRWVMQDGREISEKVHRGIRTWEDVSRFAEVAIRDADNNVRGESRAESVEIELERYFLPTFSTDIPERQKEKLIELSERYPSRPFSIQIHTNAQESPRVFHFEDGCMIDSETAWNPQVAKWWQSDKVQEIITEYLRHRPFERALMNAVMIAHFEDENAFLGDFLDRVLMRYPLPDKRSHIFAHLNALKKNITKELLLAAKRMDVSPPPGAFYWDPVETILRQHPRRPDSPAAFLYGMGALATTSQLVRNLMDKGVLSLETRITGVDRNQAQLDEIKKTGRMKLLLPNAALNGPLQPMEVDVVNEVQLHEALLSLRPEVVFFNLKASVLPTVFTDRLIRVLRLLMPAMPTPAKAYGTPKAVLPYMEVYRKLADVDQGLADHLQVLGGFFAADQLIKRFKVHMVAAGGSEKGLEKTTKYISAVPLNSKNQSETNWLSWQIIPGVEIAAAIMAGGANKNWETYLHMWLLMQMILDNPQVTHSEIAQKINELVPNGIEISEETIARVLAIYGINTDGIESPNAVKMDHTNCFPADVDIRDLLKIAEQGRELALSLDLKAMEALIARNQRGYGGGTRNAADPRMDSLIFYVYDRGISKSAKPVVSWEAFKSIPFSIAETEDSLDWNHTLHAAHQFLTDTGIVLEFDNLSSQFSDALQKLVAHRKLKNNADGHVILLRQLFRSLELEGMFVVPVEDFYDLHYPEAWKGAGQQEGKNAIPVMMGFSQEAGVVLPKPAYDANRIINRLRPEKWMEAPPELKVRELQDSDDPHWGVDPEWLNGLEAQLALLKVKASAFMKTTGRAIDKKTALAKQFRSLAAHLDAAPVKESAYAEIRRRAGVIRGQVEELARIFEENNLKPSAVVDAVMTLNQVVEAVKPSITDPKSTTEVLNQIRICAKGLERVASSLLYGIKHRELIPRRDSIIIEKDSGAVELEVRPESDSSDFVTLATNEIPYAHQGMSRASNGTQASLQHLTQPNSRSTGPQYLFNGAAAFIADPVLSIPKRSALAELPQRTVAHRFWGSRPQQHFNRTARHHAANRHLRNAAVTRRAQSVARASRLAAMTRLAAPMRTVSSPAFHFAVRR